MAEKYQVYKCEKCGNIVEVLHGGPGTLICCNEPMKLFDERSEDSKVEKHVPVIEYLDNGIRVTVGSTLHPMTEKHWIEWIELIADGKLYRQYLNPGDAPVAYFALKAEKVKAREYCNIHGLWKSED